MKKKGNGEGTVYQRKSGDWVALMSSGRKADGTLRRVCFAGKTRRIVQTKLTAALADREKGNFADAGGSLSASGWRPG